MRADFLADRSVPFWLLLISLVAADTGGLVFLILPGLSWKAGGALEFLQLAFGLLLGRLIVAIWILPWFFQGDDMGDDLTAYQFLGRRLRLRLQQLTSGLFLVMRTVAEGLKLYLAALVVTELIPLKPGWSILLTGLFTLAYTARGGIRAVLWTTLLQYLLFSGVALAIFLLILGQLPGGWAQFFELGTEAGKFQVVRPWPESGGLRGLARFQGSFADHRWLLAGLVGGVFLSMASHGADQVAVQRYLCATSKGAARVALIGGSVIAFFQCALYLAIGIGIYCLQASGNWTPLGAVATDRVLGKFIAEAGGVGWSGLLGAAILAGAMCSLSASCNASASAILGDFVRPWYPRLSEELELIVSRWSLCVVALLQMAIAWIAWGAIEDQAAIEWILQVSGFLAGPMLGVVLMAIMRVPPRSSAAMGGVILGSSVVGVVWLPTLWGQPFLAYPWYAPLGALATWGLGVVLDMPLRKKKIKKTKRSVGT